MAKNKPRGRFWQRLHYLIRLFGLLGFLSAAIGLVLASVGGLVPARPATWAEATEAGQGYVDRFLGNVGDNYAQWTSRLLLGGVAVLLFTLLVEVLLVLRFAAARRSAAGGNALIQVGLATALLVGVNLYSYYHYLRQDWTRDGTFTLPEELAAQLRQLKGETTVVVYRPRQTTGSPAEMHYQSQANRKVIEKVKDLVDQLREFGPRFRVVVLDLEDEDFEQNLDRLKADSPELRAAIELTPENSIFFQAGNRVQRLSFNDLYRLDLTASREDGDGRGNLVLLSQGVGPFVSKVLNIDEKKPRVALATIHEVLTFEGDREIGMAGAKKTLVEHGFETRDVVLKKWGEFSGPEPAVLTFDENRFEGLEEQLAELDESLKSLRQEAPALRGFVKEWQTKKLPELQKNPVARRISLGAQTLDKIDLRRVAEEDQEEVRKGVLAMLERSLIVLDEELKQTEKDRASLAEERGKLNVDDIAEKRRIADLRAKMSRLLADCDLLIVPRLTLINVARNDMIPNSVYKLEEGQITAVREFLKAGKPVLFCLGPTNEPANRRPDMDGGPDKLEDLLKDLGVKLPKQTVLFNVESKSFAERRGNLLIQGTPSEVPPLEFDPADAAVRRVAAAGGAKKSNPIRESLRLVGRSGGKGSSLELRLRNARPVYYDPPGGATMEPEFLLTSAASWNEDNPFPSRERTPRYEPSKADDPANGTVEEKRRGPFPVGVAGEAPVPKTWYDDPQATPARARFAVIGHGGAFTGTNLSPAGQRLLLDVSNWLLGRDDLLPQASTQWKYPRVALSERDTGLWQWGTRLGLPLLFAWLGLVVLMARRVR